MVLTDENITVTFSMMENEGMTRGGEVGVPVNPDDLSEGVKWKALDDLHDDDFDTIEDYFLLKRAKE